MPTSAMPESDPLREKSEAFVKQHDQARLDAAANYVGGHPELASLLDRAATLPQHVQDDLTRRMKDSNGDTSSLNDLQAVLAGQPCRYNAAPASSPDEVRQLLCEAKDGTNAVRRAAAEDRLRATPIELFPSV